MIATVGIAVRGGFYGRLAVSDFRESVIIVAENIRNDDYLGS